MKRKVERDNIPGKADRLKPVTTIFLRKVKPGQNNEKYRKNETRITLHKKLKISEKRKIGSGHF